MGIAKQGLAAECGSIEQRRPAREVIEVCIHRVAKYHALSLQSAADGYVRPTCFTGEKLRAFQHQFILKTGIAEIWPNFENRPGKIGHLFESAIGEICPLLYLTVLQAKLFLNTGILQVQYPDNYAVLDVHCFGCAHRFFDPYRFDGPLHIWRSGAKTNRRACQQIVSRTHGARLYSAPAFLATVSF